MNFRLVLTVVALGFIVLLLVIGIRTAVRWLKIHYPQRANAVLFGVCLLLAGAGVFDCHRDEGSTDLPAE